MKEKLKDFLGLLLLASPILVYLFILMCIILFWVGAFFAIWKYVLSS